MRTPILVVVGGLALGCGGPRLMNRVEVPSQIQPLPDRAVVVFIRPSRYGRKANFRLVDGQGNYLGDLLGRQYFVSALPPGQHEFVLHAENNDLVQASLTAGRVYYVLVSVRMGAWKARGSISALTPRREEWPSLEEYMSSSVQMTPDMAVARERLDPSEFMEWIAEARESFASYDPNERALRVLGPTDGIGPGPAQTAGGMQPMPAGAQPAPAGRRAACAHGTQPTPTAPAT